MSSTPIPSATILMVREGAAPLEVFMVVRHHQIDFASGALVFPGGKVDDKDHLALSYCDGGAEDEFARTLQIAAIREAFEECGILLARPKGSVELIPGEQLKALEHYREPLAKSELGIAEFLEKENLRLACDQLVPFAHWVTPEMMPKRFDTFFYMAVAPGDHIAIHDGYESVDSIWISPVDALEGARSGKYTIIFPTRVNVELLAESQTVEAAIDSSRSRNIVSVLPWTEQREDGNYVCIPADAGYQTVAERMAPLPE